MHIWRCVRRVKNDGGAEILRELVRTNDAVVISAIEALLNGAGIPHFIADQNMSVLEGSVGILPRRVLVFRASNVLKSLINGASGEAVVKG